MQVTSPFRLIALDQMDGGQLASFTPSKGKPIMGITLARAPNHEGFSILVLPEQPSSGPFRIVDSETFAPHALRVEAAVVVVPLDAAPSTSSLRDAPAGALTLTSGGDHLVLAESDEAARRRVWVSLASGELRKPEEDAPWFGRWWLGARDETGALQALRRFDVGA